MAELHAGTPTVPGRNGRWGDVLASLVVFMVALPLCIGIAQACGLPPETGIVTGILAFDRRAKSDDECPAERCTQRGVDLNEQAKTYAWLSNIGIGVGLLAAGAGVVLVLTAPKAPKTAAIRIVPAVGPGIAGLSAAGVF